MNSLDLPSITAAGRPIVIDPTDKARPYLDDRRDGCVSRWLARRLAKSASAGLWYASPLILVLLVGFVAPLFSVIEQLESILQSRNATAVLADAPRPANSQAEDAARWHEVLQHVGGCVAPVVGYGLHVSTLRPLPGANTLHGSVAEHFTKAIDAIRNHV